MLSKRRGNTELECKNRCETQFKIQKNTFSKINLFVGEKEVNKRNRKKISGHFNTNGLLVRKS